MTLKPTLSLALAALLALLAASGCLGPSERTNHPPGPDPHREYTTTNVTYDGLLLLFLCPSASGGGSVSAPCWALESKNILHDLRVGKDLDRYDLNLTWTSTGDFDKTLRFDAIPMDAGCQWIQRNCYGDFPITSKTGTSPLRLNTTSLLEDGADQLRLIVWAANPLPPAPLLFTLDAKFQVQGTTTTRTLSYD